MELVTIIRLAAAALALILLCDIVGRRKQTTKRQ
jgi:hypothetical protein